MGSNYKVGDLVRILNPIPKRSMVGVNTAMEKYADKIVPIKEIFPYAGTFDGYIYRLEGTDGWNWESSMFTRALNFDLNIDEEDIQDASFGAFFSAYKSS